MQAVGQGWLIVHHLNGTPLELGMVAFAGYVPILCLAPLAGVIADRVPRHRVLIGTQSLLMLLALAGMRYDLDPNRRNGTFFTMAIGVNHVRASVEGMGVKESDSSTSLTLDIGGGFQAGPVQMRGTIFYTPHIGASREGDTTSYLGLAVAFGYDIVVK